MPGVPSCLYLTALCYIHVFKVLSVWLSLFYKYFLPPNCLHLELIGYKKDTFPRVCLVKL